MEKIEIDPLSQNQEIRHSSKISENQSAIISGSIISLEETLLVLEENGESEKIKIPIQELLATVKESSLCGNLPFALLNKIKLITLAVAEMLFLDEMCGDVENETEASELMTRRYGRDWPPTFEGYLRAEGEDKSNSKISYIFLDMKTLEDDIQALIEAGKESRMRVRTYIGKNPDTERKRREHNSEFPFVVLNDYAELERVGIENNRKLLVVSEIFQNYAESEKSNEIIGNLMKDQSFKNIIIMGLKLTEKVGVMQVIEGNDVRVRSSLFRKHPLPMQEKLLAMLENGISYLSLEKSDDISGLQECEKENMKLEELNHRLDGSLNSLIALEKSKSDRYYRRKISVFVNNQEERKLLEGHEAHYKKFFSTDGKSADELLLTRSGISANNLAIQGLKDIMPDNTKAYYQDGWYYDNVASLKDSYKMTKESKDADIVFINLDSCYPDKPEDFHSQQRALIEGLIEKAQKNEHRKYALVVDVTTNLLWGDELNIPDNLILVKTFSLTKHQRGSRNYFYGGIASWNSEELRTKMEDKADNFGGRMMTTGIIHLPRLRKKEISRNMEHLNLLTDAFKKGMKMGMVGFPENEKLKLYAYNYYSYVVFPAELSEYPILSKIKDMQGLKWDFGDLAEPGDSFGLETTRVTYVPRAVESGEVAIRFSFGLKESEDRVFRLGIEVSKKWDKLLEKTKQEKTEERS